MSTLWSWGKAPEGLSAGVGQGTAPPVGLGQGTAPQGPAASSPAQESRRPGESLAGPRPSLFQLMVTRSGGVSSLSTTELQAAGSTSPDPSLQPDPCSEARHCVTMQLLMEIRRSPSAESLRVESDTRRSVLTRSVPLPFASVSSWARPSGSTSVVSWASGALFLLSRASSFFLSCSSRGFLSCDAATALCTFVAYTWQLYWPGSNMH
mmetsp:Transcript_77348/g.129795  ORF Transcript_77348/g.129795 Transcript_77348/m.129795 type:complete len:208 (-) Transcript_77348:1553-2176(-)